MSLLDDTVTVFLGAKALIEKGWTTFAFARDSLGESTASSDSSAVCWCLRGALDAAGRRGPRDARWHAYAVMTDVLKRKYGADMSMFKFNDMLGRTQADIVAVLEEAIAHAGVVCASV